MTARSVRVRPGPSATTWLIEQVRLLQAGDPLSPVTVLAPTHHAGLHVRRRLAAGGYANVRLTVLPRLAEALGAPRLAGQGRAPLTAVTRAALVRGALRAAGGPLAAGADHTGLVDLVADLACALRMSADPGRDALRGRAATATAAAALDTVVEYERRRDEAGLYDEVDLLEAAAAAVMGGTAGVTLHDAGAVVVHMAPRLEPPQERLLSALGEELPLVVSLPELGDGDGSIAATSVLATVPAAPVASAPPGSLRVEMAPDPVAEVRSAVRQLLASAERDEPIPLDRAAIVYRDAGTYGPLLRDALDEAGVPHVALDGSPLGDSVAARGLLGLIRLRQEDFARGAVLSWLSGMPDGGDARRSQARWDQLSRDAGVVRGAREWRDRLTALAHARDLARAGLGDDDAEDSTVEGRRAALQRDSDDARCVADEVARIDDAIRAPESQTWDGYVAWALHLHDDLLAPGSGWSAEDREAWQAVGEVLRGLVAAGAVEPAVSLPIFLRALEDGLRGRRRPEGHAGRGVIIGPHRLLLGMDVRRVHLLGAVEGSLPAALPVDPLLTGDPLERRPRHEAEERRDWLAALAAADGGEVTVSAPTVDVEGRSAYPSPWVLDLLAGTERRPAATDVRAGRAVHPRLRYGGGAGASGDATAPLSLAERREAEARACRRAGRDLASSPLARRHDLPLGGVLQVVRARRSGELTEFDGNLSGAADVDLVGRGLTGSSQSATGLEAWAKCPFRFLLGRVLLVRETEDVDDDRWWGIDPAARGSLVHTILERFFTGVVTTGQPPPGAPYSADDVARMEAIAEEAFSTAEARGVAGHPMVWANERAAILADLRTLLERDAEWRTAGWRPAHLEQRFGFEGDAGSWPAVVVPLRDGRSVLLRGVIDRVDVDEGGRARVIDYKTGRRHVTSISVEDRLDHGRQLQLAVYGRAVRDRERAQGRDTGPTPSLYWHISLAGRFRAVELRVDAAVEEVLREDVELIDGGVRAGCFPQAPGEFEEWRGRCESCRYCPYDSLCPSGREVAAAAKAGSPVMAPHLALRPSAPGDGVW